MKRDDRVTITEHLHDKDLRVCYALKGDVGIVECEVAEDLWIVYFPTRGGVMLYVRDYQLEGYRK